MTPREIIEGRVKEGQSIENQLGYYRLIKFGKMVQKLFDEAKPYRELDKECVRMLKEQNQMDFGNTNDTNDSPYNSDK